MKKLCRIALSAITATLAVTTIMYANKLAKRTFGGEEIVREDLQYDVFRQIVSQSDDYDTLRVDAAGAITGMDSVFIVSMVEDADEETAIVRSEASPEGFAVEKAALRALLPMQADAEELYILYPYRVNGWFLSEEELAGTCPLLYAYLLEHKDRLAARSNVRAWYAWYNVLGTSVPTIPAEIREISDIRAAMDELTCQKDVEHWFANVYTGRRRLDAGTERRVETGCGTMDITEAYIEGNYARYTIRLRCDMGQLVGNTCEKLEYEASRIAAACVRRQWNGDRDGALAARRQLCGVMQELLAFGYECRNRPSWATSEIIIQNEQGL